MQDNVLYVLRMYVDTDNKEEVTMILTIGVIQKELHDMPTVIVSHELSKASK